MKPVIGSCSEIVAQALALGLLCRPVLTRGANIGAGEALEVGKDSFWHYYAGDPTLPVTAYTVSPWELTLDWELTTKDLLRAEYRRFTEDPW